MSERRMLAAIMFTDIVGYTRLMNEREAIALASLRAHNKVFDELAFKYSGLVVKSIGDSYLMEFPSAVNAVQCALEAQDAFETRNRDLPEDSRLKVRVSIHVGDVVVDDQDVYGDGVNIASRLQSVTPGGGVALSREAYAQIKSRFGKRFVSLGPQALKGLAEPVEVFMNSEAAGQPGSGALGNKIALNVVVPDLPPQVVPESEPARSGSAFGSVEGAAAEQAAVMPEPPPSPPIGPPGPTAATYVVFAGLFALFFGRPWLSVTGADWLGCGWAAALFSVALTQAAKRSGVLRAAGVILMLDSAFSFFQLGSASGDVGFEILVVGCLGAVAAAAGIYLGFIDSEPDARLAGGLLLGATALLTVAGCARALPASASWASELPHFWRGQLARIGATGGAWRWAGFAVVYAGWKAASLSSFDPVDWSRSNVGSDGRRLNWNV